MTRRAVTGPPAGFDLCGWDPILAVVGLTEATARRAMKRATDPLPAVAYFGKVVARRAELIAWAERAAARRGAPSRRAST
jgi:hypothetical protein